MLLDAGAKPNTASVSHRSALWTACVKGLRDVALLLLERGADPYAAQQGTESAVDALRRIGGKAAMGLHAELTHRTTKNEASAEGASHEHEDDEGEEGEEGEGEEEEEEEERDARKALAAAAPKEIYVPSLHPHPLQACRRENYCCVRGPGCKFSPTAYTCVECTSRCHGCDPLLVTSHNDHDQADGGENLLRSNLVEFSRFSRETSHFLSRRVSLLRAHSPLPPHLH